jgi:hypothetical protein
MAVEKDCEIEDFPAFPASFGWSSETNRVVSLVTHTDILSPQMHELGCLDEVSRVFEGARECRLTKTCFM